MTALVRKCAVISYSSDEPTWGEVLMGDCENEATEFVANEDREAVNRKLEMGGERLVGNDICDEHCERVGDI